MDGYQKARRATELALTEVLRLGLNESPISPRRAALGQVAQWLQESATWLDRLADGRLPTNSEGK